MPENNLPDALLKIGLALAKHHIKNVIGDEALEVVAETLADVGGEKVQAKVDSIFASKEGQKELLRAAKAADEKFKKECQDNDLRQLFSMDYGSLSSVQEAIANLPEALDDESLRETLFTAFRNDAPRRIGDEKINEGVNLYIECLQSALIPVKDFGVHIIYSALKEIGKDVKGIKADVKKLLEKTATSSQGAANSKNFTHFLVPFPHNPDFVGRDTELSSLHEMLQRKESIVGIRPTVLVGLGGIGKTQLAVEYAHAHRNDYSGGIFWLNAIEPLANEFARLANQLELVSTDTPLTIAAQRCYEYLNQHTDSLVVFDNVEEPSSLNVPFAECLIAANLKCATLFTTRKRDFPAPFQPFEVKTLPEAAAMQLLLKHTSRQPILEPNHPDHGLARVICITLGYLPLALALASAYLGKHSKISLYDYRIRILEEGAMDVIDATHVRTEEMPTRHQAAVNATLKTSWDAVTDENARLAFRAAGKFRQAEMIPNARLGLVTGLAMQAKPGYLVPLDDALEILHTASLIEELDESRQRLRLHPLVQEFASLLSPPDFSLGMAKRVAAIVNDLACLDERVMKYGVDFVLEDLRTGLGLCGDKRDNETYDQIYRLERVLDRETHHLRDWKLSTQPSFFLQSFHNQAIDLGYDDIARRTETRLAERKLPYLRERFPISRESQELVRTLEGHTDSVYGVAVTADGRWAISASGDKTLKVWDITAGQCIRTLEGHTELVLGVAATADGQWAVSASFDKTLKVWDIATGQCVRTLEGHTEFVLGVAITADRRWVVSASSDKTLKIWDLSTGQCARTFEGHTESVPGVAVTADGRWVVSASSDKTLKVWDTATGQCVRTLEGHTGSVDGVAVTADGRWAVSVSEDKMLKVWDIMTGQCMHTFVLAGHQVRVIDVAVTADGRRAISASYDRTLKVWDIMTGQCVQTLQGHSNHVEGVAVTADGRWVLSASRDKTLKVWDLSTRQPIRTIKGHTDSVKGVTITADGRWVLSASRDKTLKVWDLSTGQCIQTLEGHSYDVNGIAVTADGRWAVSASDDETLRLWDLSRRQRARRLKEHLEQVNGVAITADGRWAVSASGDKTIKVWDINTRQPIRTLKGHIGGVEGVAVTADGRWVVSASDDTTLKVWDIMARQCVRTLEGHTESVLGVAVTADGRWVVSASRDKTLKIWDLSTGQCVRTLEGHSDDVNGVVATADGCWVVSASSDKTLKIWDLSTGQCVLTIMGIFGFNCCAVAPDGRTVVTGDEGGAVHFIEWVKFDS